jgi:hypothetical protein
VCRSVCRSTVPVFQLKVKKDYSGTGTRTPVSSVRGTYDNHLHYTGILWTVTQALHNNIVTNQRSIVLPSPVCFGTIHAFSLLSPRLSHNFLITSSHLHCVLYKWFDHRSSLLLGLLVPVIYLLFTVNCRKAR